jgi:hypothetical protein
MCQNTSPINDLESQFGRAITPKELAKFLGVDRRTVVKYAGWWGGVEVSPGNFRFFEKLIRRRLNALHCNEEWETQGPGRCDGQWGKKDQDFPGRKQKEPKSCSNLGGRNTQSTSRATPDTHGVFDLG